MKVNKWVMAVLVTILAVGVVTALLLSKKEEVALEPLLGGDRDEHGCIASAGYSWCEVKQKCLRVWEEPCVAEEVGVDEIEFLKAEIRDTIVAKHGGGAGNLDISVTKLLGDYASGDVSEVGMGGGMWFGARVDGSWELVWDGNGIITCEELEKYPEFPVELIPECYDVAAGVMVGR